LSILDVISDPTYQAVVNALVSLGTALGIGYGIGHFIGWYLTKRGSEKTLERERQQQQVDWGITELRSRIRWINDMRTDVRTRITPNTSPEVERAYLDLIDDLETYRVQLQAVLDSVAEQQQQRQQR
jgi:hypothetical protein